MSQPGLRTLRGPVHILGVPLDIGQTVRGTDVGPAAIRYAGLLRRVRELGINAEDLGNLEVPLSSAVDASQIVATIAEVCERLRDRVEASVRSGAVAITLGGDHSVAIGSVAGTLRAAPAGLLWIDAHGDFNTPETSPSGNVHGMPLAVLLGHGDSRLLRVCEGIGLEPHQVALVGIRQLDAREREHLGKAGVHVFTMRDIDERGMGTVAHEAIERVSSAGRVHVSLDIDVLDPDEAPGTSTPVRGGLSYREAHLLLEVLADKQALVAMDVVEVNPMLDVRNRTAQTAVELLISALGRRII